MASLIDFLFGCWHRNYSFPITAKKGARMRPVAAQQTGTYVVCLDCGKEFPYDWKAMKMLSLKKSEDRGGSLEPAESFLNHRPA